MNHIITTGVIIVLIIFGFYKIAQLDIKNAEQAKSNKLKHTTEIRQTTRECLLSVRSNPQVQNFNDDNEIVKSCTEYALNLYGAN